MGELLFVVFMGQYGWYKENEDKMREKSSLQRSFITHFANRIHIKKMYFIVALRGLLSKLHNGKRSRVGAGYEK